MSGIIIPGPSGIPVDPNDPTKGTLTPVMNAQQLTAAVQELYERTEILLQRVSLVGGMAQDAFADIGSLLEALILDITHEVADDDTSWLGNDVQEFLNARAAARELSEAELDEARRAVESVQNPDEPTRLDMP